MLELNTPFSYEEIENLHVGDMIYISGEIFCGRDAVLPKIVRLAENNMLESAGINMTGSVIFHTAVSPAGIGPTSSNKLEIESSMEPLSRMAGVKMHLGKGAIKKETIKALKEHNAVYAVIPPVTALLESKTSDKITAAFPELGMEALYKVKIERYPVIIAAAHGESIYD